MSVSSSTFFARLSIVIHKIHRIEDGILALILFSMILIATSQIFLRNFFDSGFVWADPLLRIMVLWIGLLGALAATRENKHISIDLLTRFLSAPAQNFSKSFVNIFSAGVAGLLTYHCVRYVIMEYESQATVITDIPIWMVELILPVAFGLITIRFIIHFIISLRAFINRPPPDLELQHNQDSKND